jgi:hypothetical protein
MVTLQDVRVILTALQNNPQSMISFPATVRLNLRWSVGCPVGMELDRAFQEALVMQVSLISNQFRTIFKCVPTDFSFHVALPSQYAMQRNPCSRCQ